MGGSPSLSHGVVQQGVWSGEDTHTLSAYHQVLPTNRVHTRHTCVLPHHVLRAFFRTIRSDYVSPSPRALPVSVPTPGKSSSSGSSGSSSDKDEKVSKIQPKGGSSGSDDGDGGGGGGGGCHYWGGEEGGIGCWLWDGGEGMN